MGGADTHANVHCYTIVRACLRLSEWLQGQASSQHWVQDNKLTYVATSDVLMGGYIGQRLTGIRSNSSFLRDHRMVTVQQDISKSMSSCRLANRAWQVSIESSWWLRTLYSVLLPETSWWAVAHLQYGSPSDCIKP